MARDLAFYGLPQLDASLHGAAISAIAGGPLGFVILGNDRVTGALVSWASRDGGTWTRRWLPGATFGGGTPDRLVGGSFGFEALGWSPVPGSAARRLWSSPDGIAWGPLPESSQPSGEVTALVAGPWGPIVALDRGDRGAALATTTDGIRWHDADLPIGALANVFALVALPDGVLAIGASAASQSSGVAALSAWRSRDGQTWTETPGIAEAIGARENSIEVWQTSPWGAAGEDLTNAVAGVVTEDGFQPVAAPPDPWGRLVGGPAGLLWIKGSDRTASCSAGWAYDGSAWRPLDGTHDDPACVEAAGPSVLDSASTPDAMVVLAMLGTSVDRVAWLVRRPSSPPDGAEVEGLADPPASAFPDPVAATIERPTTCPSLPGTLDAVLAITARTAVGCFGDRSMTFRAWIVDPGEGYGGTCAPFTPSWIHECVLADYLLAATSTGNDESTVRLHAMRSPAATGSTKGVGRWVRITGHYDDAVSPSCRGTGDMGTVGLEPEIPRAVAVLGCRLVFVVTDVRNAA